MRPFKVVFKTDANEVAGATTAGNPTAVPAIAPANADVNEAGAFPGGIIGFSLNYFQVGC